MNSLIKELCELSGINGDIELRTTRIEHGSVELYSLFHFTLVSTPFATPQELFDFLKIAAPELLQKAQQYFSTIQGVHRDMNSYFKENPFDTEVLAGLLVTFIVGSFRWAGKQKTRPVTHDDQMGEITPRQAGKLRAMVQVGRYRKVVRPIIDGTVSELSVIAANARQDRRATINEGNIGDYLPEDAQILPELTNGSVHKLTGEVVGLQSTRGETIKVRVHGIDPSYNLLVAHPDDGQDSEDYKDFYKKPVLFTAEVFRKSMYKRPELVIKSMELHQNSLEI
jgi:hypothetical protein